MWKVSSPSRWSEPWMICRCCASWPQRRLRRPIPRNPCNCMRRFILIAGLCGLLPGAAVSADQRPPKPPPARKAANAKAKAAAKAQEAREPESKEAPPALERWSRMTPEERGRALARLSPERRRELQQKLQEFRNLPPEQKQQLGERYRAFSQLPPDRQNHARELFRQFNSLPDDRRPLVKQEYEQLRAMPESEREVRMNSEAFRSRYSPSEQQMLRDLSQTFGSPR